MKFGSQKWDTFWQFCIVQIHYYIITPFTAFTGLTDSSHCLLCVTAGRTCWVAFETPSGGMEGIVLILHDSRGNVSLFIQFQLPDRLYNMSSYSLGKICPLPRFLTIQLAFPQLVQVWKSRILTHCPAMPGQHAGFLTDNPFQWSWWWHFQYQLGR